MRLVLSLFNGFIFTLLFGGCTGCLDHSRDHAQIGTYVIDINRTELGIYLKDSALYKDLTISFKGDFSFIMNKKVPFIFDSIGTWTSKGTDVEDWYWMVYKNSKIDTQWSGCCFDGNFILLNSVTPQVGKKSVSQIYFQKLK